MKKYTAQPRKILHETPETYRSVVLPYIESFPPERLEWVRAILEGRKEAERIVFRSPSLDKLSSASAANSESEIAEAGKGDIEANGNISEHPNEGFVLVPDLKWDGTTVRQLYLTAIVGDASIRTVRDLTAKHLPLLREIKRQAYASAKERYGVGHGDLRMFVHYQPSYCEYSGSSQLPLCALCFVFRQPLMLLGPSRIRTPTRTIHALAPRYASSTASPHLLAGSLFQRSVLTTDHFHVHITHVAHDMLAGMAVGQAHLLDDVINWVGFSSQTCHGPPQV